MIRIFTGDDRKQAFLEIKRVLGLNYEVFEGERVEPALLPSIFLGTSLLSEKRAILVKDLGENRESFQAFIEGIEGFLKTDAEVILWETKLDKRTTAFRELKKQGIEIREFKEVATVDVRRVFGIYDLAMRDGKKADFQFDASFTYELAVMNETATMLFKKIPEGIERFDELKTVFPALLLFGNIDESLVAEDAMLREFIGGGIYEY